MRLFIITRARDKIFVLRVHEPTLAVYSIWRVREPHSQSTSREAKGILQVGLIAFFTFEFNLFALAQIKACPCMKSIQLKF